MKKIIVLSVMSLLASCAMLPRGAGYYAPDPEGVPRFLTTDIVDLNQISNISKFRSMAGHEYVDMFETERSMKHYFMPAPQYGFTSNVITITSPVDGILSMKYWEGRRSYQIRIQPYDYPWLGLVVFHVTTALEQGAVLTQGQLIGHADVTSDRVSEPPSTDFDIAVWLNSGRLISYFTVMSDSLFSNYMARGLSNRNEIIISQEEADANPWTFDTIQESQSYNRSNDWVFLSP